MTVASTKDILNQLNATAPKTSEETGVSEALIRISDSPIRPDLKMEDILANCLNPAKQNKIPG